MSVNPESLQCWIVTEGMAGTENQCLGVAEALGITPVIKRVTLRQPWKALSPWIGFEQAWTFVPHLTPPWPDLFLAAGRKSVAASRYIRKMSGGKTLTVQIQDPRTNPCQFDLVCVPAHDRLRGDNVVVTLGAPNRITQDRLARAKSDFAPLFAMLPSPRVAVLVGGKSKAHHLSLQGMASLGQKLAALPASLMITASRRTSEAEKAAMMATLKQRDSRHGIWVWDSTGDNPYAGMLAWADYIIVTEDSVSMASDAATTGKPVYIAKMEGGSSRLNAFHAGMASHGATRPFDGFLDNWQYTPLADSAMIAKIILEKLNAHDKRG